MSDVVAVGLITGAVGILSAWLSYRSAARTAAVELAKLKAENERLREQHREDERRNRQGTYHRAIAAIYTLANLAPGGQTPKEEARQLLGEWRFAAAGCQLFGSPAVAAELVDVSNAIIEPLTDKSKGQILKAAEPLIEAMRADVLANPDK